MIEDAAWNYPEPLEGCVDVKDLIAFYWNKMDAWFEEDDEVFIGPRDPYTRVDCLGSSRHIQVVVAGTTVADTNRAIMLVETGLPPRFYIPKLDVSIAYLQQSERVARSQYKGEAIYYHLAIGDQVAEDVVWSYPNPTLECARIAGYLCFPQSRVDLYIDGVLAGKDRTRWD